MTVALPHTRRFEPLRVGFCGGLAAVRCSASVFYFFIFFLSTRNLAFFCQHPVLFFSVKT
jgi:hypothetical protein